MSRKSLGLTPEEMKAHRAKLAKLRKQKRREIENRLCKEVVAQRLAQVCSNIVIDKIGSEYDSSLTEAIYEGIVSEFAKRPEWTIKVE